MSNESPETRLCALCGKPFPAQHRDKAFCSQSCQRKAKRIGVRPRILTAPPPRCAGHIRAGAHVGPLDNAGADFAWYAEHAETAADRAFAALMASRLRARR